MRPPTALKPAIHPPTRMGIPTQIPIKIRVPLQASTHLDTAVAMPQRIARVIIILHPTRTGIYNNQPTFLNVQTVLRQTCGVFVAATPLIVAAEVTIIPHLTRTTGRLEPQPILAARCAIPPISTHLDTAVAMPRWIARQ